MASAMFRSGPPTPSSPLRRPVPVSPRETVRPSPWTLASQPLGPGSPAPLPRPRSLTPLLDAIGRARLHALSRRSDATDAVSPRKVLPPCVGRGGLPPGLSSTLGSSAVGRVVPKETESGCICQRAHAVVLCHVCGWYSRCRLMKPCREHPNTRFLLDITVCPRCRAPSHQMDEYDMGNEELPPCPLLMPEPAYGPTLSRRSISPDLPEGRGGAGPMSPVKLAASRTRMRPPLQSDSHGMQRKMRDRFCAQSVPSQCVQHIQTPSGLPMPFGGEASLQHSASSGPYGLPFASGPGDAQQSGCGADFGFGYSSDRRKRF